MTISFCKPFLLPVFSAILLVACGGGGGGSTTPTTPPPSPTPTPTPTAPVAPTLNPAAYDIRQLVFTWADVSGATYYRMLENPDGVSGYTQIGSDIPYSAVTASSYEHDISVHFQDWPNASYILQACNTVGCTDSAAITATDSAQAIGYFKASNTDAGDAFGFDVAVSGDGATLVVGARDEDSSATGINSGAVAEADDSAAQAGAAYVFFHDSTGWMQQAYVKGDNTGAGDEFGRRVAISQDGNTMAIGAHKEDGAGDASGAVYVFVRSAGIWTQQQYLQASNAEAGDNFGYDLALSADGNTLTVGAIGEASSANLIDGNQADNTNGNSGAVYIFTRSGGTWSQAAYVKASNSAAGDNFGYSVALSDDGNTLAVGALWEDGGIPGIDSTADNAGSEADNSALQAGAAYVFFYNGATWVQQAYVKASNPDADDFFGQAVSLSSDGDTLAVGANGEDSNAVTIGGNEGDDSALSAGAAYVFSRSGSAWSQQAYVKASNSQASDNFGFALTLSNDGNTLAVGAGVNTGPGGEQSNATGIDGSQVDNSADDSGAVYLYTRSVTTWSQAAYVKASNTDASDSFGAALSLSDDGRVMAVGAHGESGADTGISGNQSSDAAGVSGAVYLY